MRRALVVGGTGGLSGAVAELVRDGCRTGSRRTCPSSPKPGLFTAVELTAGSGAGSHEAGLAGAQKVVDDALDELTGDVLAAE